MKTQRGLLSLTRSFWQHRAPKKCWGDIWNASLISWCCWDTTGAENSPVRLSLLIPLWFPRPLSCVHKSCQPKKSTQGVMFTSGFLLELHGINKKNVYSYRHPLQLFDLQNNQGSLRVGMCGGRVLWPCSSLLLAPPMLFSTVTFEPNYP